VFHPLGNATTLVSESGGGAVFYLDERTYAPGRFLAGTIDPDCHAGYGSDRTRPLLRAILEWVYATRPEAASQELSRAPQCVARDLALSSYGRTRTVRERTWPGAEILPSSVHRPVTLAIERRGA